MRRCKRCIVPETVPGIEFNKDGLCTYCQDYKHPTYYGKNELEDVIAKGRNKNNKYDCIVPASGGRDSTYLLYLAKNIYNLKVLAVNYDNEFATDQAIVNLKRACKILDIDLVRFRSKRNIAHKIAKFNIRASSEFGQFRECAGCTYGYISVVYKSAIQHKAPMIFWGESRQEATKEMELKAFEVIRNHKLKYLKLFNINFYIAEYYRLLQRLEFYISWNNIFNRRFEPIFNNKNIKDIRVFNYIPWNRKNIKDTIMNELGWEIPEGSKSTWKTDCFMIALTNFYLIKLFGCSKTCLGYCKMINNGQMTREEAINQEEYVLANYSNNVKELLEDKIGLSEKEADRIISFPT